MRTLGFWDEPWDVCPRTFQRCESTVQTEGGLNPRLAKWRVTLILTPGFGRGRRPDGVIKGQRVLRSSIITIILHFLIYFSLCHNVMLFKVQSFVCLFLLEKRQNCEFKKYIQIPAVLRGLQTCSSEKTSEEVGPARQADFQPRLRFGCVLPPFLFLSQECE